MLGIIWNYLVCLFVFLFVCETVRVIASGRNSSPPELIDSSAKWKKNLTVPLFLHFTYDVREG